MKINSKSMLNEWLDYELPRYGASKLASLFCIGERAILSKHQKLLRKTEYYSNMGNKILKYYYRLRLLKIQNKYGLHIPLNTCGKGLHIVHLGTVLINDNAVIGENCALHINTAIVAGGTNDNAPVLGNDIVVGVGAVILGEITVADGVAIGANAVVNKSVTEPHIAVAGVPAKKVSNNGSANWNASKKSSDNNE